MSHQIIKTPFDCHICGWAYVDVIEKGNKFFCQCRKCRRKTMKYDNPFDAVKQYKELEDAK